MKLVLELPNDKGFILYARELAGDENFEPHRHCYFECEESERWHANAVIREAWEDEKKEHGSRGTVFNQCQWNGTTGFEFWSSDQDAIMRASMKVAERLGLELELKCP